MKHLSIKVRVTLWYTLFMTVLTAIALSLLLLIVNWQIIASIHSKLEWVVSKNFKEIEYDDGKIEIDEDIDFFQDGVYLIVYDEEGNQIYGKLPNSLKASQTPAFKNGEMQEVKIDSVKWIFFDVYQSIREGEGIWMRGMVSRSDAESGLSIVIKLAMLLLPLFVILIALGGYYIIYRAFVPVEKMRETAREIAESNDLSRRINLGKGNDEIYQLADTFDQMLERIQETYEREKQFTSDASHELRTPISVIITQTEYSLRHENPVGELRESLETILAQSRKMSRMISQLLMLARADQGREKIEKEKVNLSELIELIADEERERAEDKSIQIIAECHPGIYLEGDKTLLMRCFMNLIENAITYGKEGGNIWITLDKQDESVRGYIKDDGIGIHEADLPRIWERFFRADTSRTSSEKGSSGLGLSMVKWIIEAHGGTITVESHYQEGTIFYFSF